VQVKKELYAKRLRAYNKNSAEVLQAFEIYKVLQKARGYKSVNDIHHFMGTKSYAHYIKFAAFVKKLHIHDVETYMKAMINNHRTLSQWTLNWSYRMYLEYVDEHKPPMDSITDTINELFNIAEQVDMGVAELIDAFQLPEILLLLHQRRLSPWIMLHSHAVKAKIMAAEESQQKEFLAMIDPDAWTIRFSKYPIAVKTAKNACKELGI